MHGRSGIKKLVLGSVAEEIVNCAPCPVLTVGPQVPPKMISELKLRENSVRDGHAARVRESASYAQALARDENAQLTLLHVLKMPADAPPEHREAQRDIAMNSSCNCFLRRRAPRGSAMR